MIEIADRYCEGRIVAVQEGGYDLDAVAQCAATLLVNLTGSDGIVDNLGEAPPLNFRWNDEAILNALYELHDLAGYRRKPRRPILPEQYVRPTEGSPHPPAPAPREERGARARQPPRGEGELLVLCGWVVSRRTRLDRGQQPDDGMPVAQAQPGDRRAGEVGGEQQHLAAAHDEDARLWPTGRVGEHIAGGVGVHAVRQHAHALRVHHPEIVPVQAPARGRGVLRDVEPRAVGGEAGLSVPVKLTFCGAAGPPSAISPDRVGPVVPASSTKAWASGLPLISATRGASAVPPEIRRASVKSPGSASAWASCPSPALKRRITGVAVALRALEQQHVEEPPAVGRERQLAAGAERDAHVAGIQPGGLAGEGRGRQAARRRRQGDRGIEARRKLGGRRTGRGVERQGAWLARHGNVEADVDRGAVGRERERDGRRIGRERQRRRVADGARRGVHGDERLLVAGGGRGELEDGAAVGADRHGIGGIRAAGGTQCGPGGWSERVTAPVRSSTARIELRTTGGPRCP